MKYKIIFVLCSVLLFSSCNYSLQLLDANSNLKGSCLLVLVNRHSSKIKVKVDDQYFEVKRFLNYSIRLPEGKHIIEFEGKVSTFDAKNLVTYKKVFK